MKLAFLFLTIGDLKFPQIWEYYFKDNWDKVNIYCHAKYADQIKTPWLKKSVIPLYETTKWGHMVLAYLALFKTAYLNPENTKFTILSESCLPVKPFDYFYNKLKQDNEKYGVETSYISLRRFADNNLRATPQGYEMLKRAMKGRRLIKHSGWFTLSRYHTEKLVNDPAAPSFNLVQAGDEHLLSVIYPDKYIRDETLLNVDWEKNIKAIHIINHKARYLRHLQETHKTLNIDAELVKLSKTKTSLGKHPYVYNYLPPSFVQEVKTNSYFFYRKFAPKSNITEYYKEILTPS